MGGKRRDKATHRDRRWHLAPVLLLALFPFACSPEETQRSPAPTTSTTSEAPSPTTATASPSASPTPRGTIATRQLRVTSGANHVAEIYALQRRGDVVVLDFGVRNKGEEPFGVGRLFGKDREVDDVSGIYLHDVENRTKYFPATAGGECVCSTDLAGFRVGPGQVQHLSATFGALPDGVDETDVHLPSVGTFEDIPIEA